MLNKNKFLPNIFSFPSQKPSKLYKSFILKGILILSSKDLNSNFLGIVIL